MLGGLTARGDVGVRSFFAGSGTCFALECVSSFGAEDRGFASFSAFLLLCFAASRSSCARFAESITPLIFAGPPLRFKLGEVGVFGEGFETVGDLGTGLVTICLVGGALTGCAVLDVCSVVADGGPGLPSCAARILLIISELLVEFLG